jgi:hypothetical protein
MIGIFRPLFAALVLCPLSWAQVINIDFDDSALPATFTGPAAAPDPAGATAIWNGLTRSGNGLISASNLVDSLGNSSGVALVIDVNDSFSSVGGEQELGAADEFASLMADYVFLAALTNAEVLTRTGTIAGLNPGGLYDVYFYGQGDNFSLPGSPGQNTLFTIGSLSQQTSWDGFAGGDGVLAEGIEYVKFTVNASGGGEVAFSYANVVAGPGGNVATDLDGSASRYAAINAIQIVAVPEPSVVLLGALGLLAFRRRR